MKNRLREFRKKAGISQRQLGRLYNPENPESGYLTITNTEHGRTFPRMETAIKIAKVLNAPFDEVWAIKENLNEI